jgi:vitamin B12 transporter
MKLIYTSAAIAALSLPASNLLANDDIDNIIVTGTRTPSNLSESLSAVTLLQRADIERYQASDLFELLSRVPSASFVRNGGRGSSTSLSLRGNQSDHSLFLIDGVRIGSATTGGANLASINLATVERIEIIRGPKSNLYGADAIGGVVNIISRKTSAASVFNVETSFGSNNTSETTAVAGLNGDRFSFTAAANALHTDGIDNTESTDGVNGDNDAYRNNSLALNLRYQLSDSATLKLSYNQNETEAEYDNSCSTGSWPNSTDVDCNIFTAGQVDALFAALEFKVSDQWHSSLQLGRTNDEAKEAADNIDLSTTSSGGMFNTQKTEATWVNNIFLADQHTLTLGLDYLRDEVTSSTTYDEATRDNEAAFAQYQIQLGAVDTNFGLRYDDNEQFGDFTTASFLAGTNLSDNVRLIGSVSEGFKAPTFNDLYYPGFGDTSFQPEESINYEIGLNATLGNSYVTVAVFNNQLENLIQYNSASFQTDQTAEVEITGIEFNVDTEVAGWALSLSGSVIDPENKANGKLLRRRAEQSMSFDADYGFDKVTLGFTLRSESNRFDDAANTVRLGGYTTSAIRASYRISDEWSVKAKVDNLMDKEYVTASSFGLGNYRSVGREAMITIAYTPSF